MRLPCSAWLWIPGTSFMKPLPLPLPSMMGGGTLNCELRKPLSPVSGFCHSILSQHLEKKHSKKMSNTND